MKILVLSDSHSSSIKIDLSSFDYAFHCGDRGFSKLSDDVIYVKGNCDFSGDKEKLVEINGKKIFITHGNLYNVKINYMNLYYKALELKADIVLFGHTHKQIVFSEDNILFINPGAYEDGCYAIINDNNIELYEKNLIKEILAFRW